MADVLLIRRADPERQRRRAVAVGQIAEEVEGVAIRRLAETKGGQWCQRRLKEHCPQAGKMFSERTQQRDQKQQGKAHPFDHCPRLPLHRLSSLQKYTYTLRNR